MKTSAGPCDYRRVTGPVTTIRVRSRCAYRDPLPETNVHTRVAHIVSSNRGSSPCAHAIPEGSFPRGWLRMGTHGSEWDEQKIHYNIINLYRIHGISVDYTYIRYNVFKCVSMGMGVSGSCDVNTYIVTYTTVIAGRNNKKKPIIDATGVTATRRWGGDK